jgi:hypothetical protein
MAEISPFLASIRCMYSDVRHDKEEMHPYQIEEALGFIRKNPFSALFISMGMGKTVICATLIAELLQDFHEGKILVIGPNRVVSDTWPSEFRAWSHTAGYDFTLIREDEDDPRIEAARLLDRRQAPDRKWDRELMVANGDCNVSEKLGPTFETKARVAIRKELAKSKKCLHFINREQVEWLCEFYGKNWPYRTVIIDESSSFKDYKTERFKALAKIRRSPGFITRLHELTATPAAETYEHLFAQMYLLDLGKRLGKNITAYRNDHFLSNKWTHKYTLRDGHEKLILEKIKDICLVMDAKDYLNVDEPNIVERPVKLPAKAMAFYDEMERESVVDLGDNVVVEAETAAALSSKLLQMASGVLYETFMLEDFDTGDFEKVKRVHHIHTAKMETLKEILEELSGEPVIVVYHFKSSLARLKKEFPKAAQMDRAGKCVKPWNDRKIPILLMHPQSGGHGLNLQFGGHNIVFYDLIWSLELWIQVIGRLARQGQKNPVLVQVLTAIGTMDIHLFKALRLKEDAQAVMLNLLKRLIRKHRKRQEEL